VGAALTRVDGRTDGRGEAEEALLAIYEGAPKNTMSRTQSADTSVSGVGCMEPLA